MAVWRNSNLDRGALAFLTAQPFAHRGLWDPAAGVQENTVEAFERAIAAGVGIELDVRLTRDGDVIVFHDETLERMTDGRGEVVRQGRDTLRELTIKGSSEKLKTLHDVMIHIKGRVPVLIEAKTTPGNHAPVCFAIRRALEGYRGAHAVMSFDPELVGWYSRHVEKVVRGLVMTEKDRFALSRWNLRHRIVRQFAVRRANPHFLAYDIRRLPNPFVQSARDAEKPVLTWTVRTDEEAALAAAHADNIIFEGSVGLKGR
jgi:glycerophosphoryl diester phosphodiesterase